MTPENDKTLRGIFHSHVIGLNEWNDRRDYRKKYEKTYDITDRNIIERLTMIIRPFDHAGSRKPLIIEDDTRNGQDEEEYVIQVGAFFPESRLYQEMRRIWSFGMCADIEGNYTDCDCCGTGLNALNTTGHGMCDECQIVHNKDSKDFNIL
jgi:hypothetical protein